MLLDEKHAGQSTNIFPVIGTLADFIKFAENRITVLYAGVLAQNLKGRSANREAAEKHLFPLLQTTLPKFGN
jgi:hypothetical protein